MILLEGRVLIDHVDEIEGCEYSSIDASDLGLKPGEWPESLNTDKGVLQRTFYHRNHGELTHVTYVCESYSLDVFNT